jgi:methylated-DNA-[protein]-cysteine S-methyltransferase
LRHYFKGQPVDFNLKLDYNVATVFQRQVWCVARTIPYGATRTYGWIAEMMGDPESKRAVGQALNANPLPLLVPCHRVVAAKGRLGGFSGGPEMKLALQKLEGTILA